MANIRGGIGDGETRRRRKSHSELDGQEPYESRGIERVTPSSDAHDPWDSRVERLHGSPSRMAATSTMPLESHSHSTSRKTRSTSDRNRRKNEHQSGEEVKHRRRRRSTVNADEQTTYVHRDHKDKERTGVSGGPTMEPNSEETESESGKEDVIKVEPAEEPRKRKIRIVYMTEEEESRAARRRERRAKEKELANVPQSSRSSIRRSHSHQSHQRSSTELLSSSLPKRSASSRDLPTESRPVLRRSKTSLPHASVKQSEPSISSSRRSSFMGSFFGSTTRQYHEPEKLVECLTCLSDDVPRSKSAKLKCGHRMCHSCLRRIFKLSVLDPQHMPPKCCTPDHIPLKHVDRLFDIHFKKNWNRKFQEFSTKNRIYCPGRRCGEWIKPGNIHKEDGRKYGKCGRCKTKVCCLCNGKWHSNQDCPKDEETNRLLEAAKDAGWQRCYNCRTMVELKEGCNHMTCHCTAEFCMICGLKWKTCNCPWFNYDAVEADRLDHIQVPVPVAVQPPQDRPERVRRARLPRNYHEEMTARQRQEQRDEELARRLQRADIEDEDDDYQGGIGDIHGVGNGADHFMNQDYVRAAHNILTGDFDQANTAANYVMGLREARGQPTQRRTSGQYPSPEILPLARTQTIREQAYNTALRPLERAAPRRMRNGFGGEPPQHELPDRRSFDGGTRPSVLAGLGGRNGNRVSAWRSHVEPGVTPEEGLLS